MKELFLTQSNSVIIGKKGSGKTMLGWVLAKSISENSGRKLYVFNHPYPELLVKLSFDIKNLNNMKHLYDLTDAVVIIDETHEIFNTSERKVNEQLKNLLAKSRQNNVCFIFICHNSYFINRSIFSFIDNKLIKEVNDKHWELERVHMKKLYEDIHITGVENYYIDSDAVKGRFKVTKPSWWIEELSFAYRSNNNKIDLFEEISKKCAQNTESAPIIQEVRQMCQKNAQKKSQQIHEKCAQNTESAPIIQEVRHKYEQEEIWDEDLNNANHSMPIESSLSLQGTSEQENIHEQI
jgi:hypothetical protein